MATIIADPDLVPSRSRAMPSGPVVIAWLLIMVFANGCSLPITEPPDFPPAIRNLLDAPVDIYEESPGTQDKPAFVARLSPGEVHELPYVGELCRDLVMVALEESKEVGRHEGRCDLDIGRVWVLHPEGNYDTDYYRNETVYWPD